MPSMPAWLWRLLAAKLSRMRCALLSSRAGLQLLRKALSRRCRTATRSLRSTGRVVPCSRRGSPPVQHTHPSFRIEAGRHSTNPTFPSPTAADKSVRPTRAMSQASEFLLSVQPRARWMRFDTAQILKRFFFCERSLLISQAAWIPVVAPLEIKTGLARFVWQNAETADALRERVFELRFPSRLLEEEGADHALIELFSGITDSRSVLAFLLGVGR